MSKIVALEVSPQAIRGAEISGYLSKKPKLLRVGEVKLEANVTGESIVLEDDIFVKALKELWVTSEFSTKIVSLIVSGRRFIVRPHSTHHTSMETIRKVLPYEASQSLPEQTEGLIYDFYPTHEVQTKLGLKTDGLVVSTPSEPINRLVLSLKQAKLGLEYVDFAPLAVTRWIMRNRPEKTYALINIREDSTDIVLAEDSMPRMVRVLSKGLNSKHRKTEREIVPTSPLLRRDVLGDHGVNLLVQDIGLTVKTQTESITEELECIFTSGPRAEDPELKKRIEGLFGIPVIPLSIDSEALNTSDKRKTVIADTVSTEVNNEDSAISDEDSASDEIDNSSFDNFVAMAGGMR